MKIHRTKDRRKLLRCEVSKGRSSECVLGGTFGRVAGFSVTLQNSRFGRRGAPFVCEGAVGMKEKIDHSLP
jgi:hypothetical protein